MWGGACACDAECCPVRAMQSVARCVFGNYTRAGWIVRQSPPAAAVPMGFRSPDDSAASSVVFARACWCVTV